MKHLLLGAALALPISAQAGGMAPPVMDVEIVEVETESRSSSAGLLIPLIVIAALIAISQGGDDPDPLAGASDARLKTDIVPVGTAANGLPLYQYRYVGSDVVFEGVMAQDVLAHTPDAVVMMPSGYMAVNYGLLGLHLTVVE